MPDASLTTLRVYTARLAYDGPDRLDISRWGNDPLGVAFAPSTELLYGMRRLHREGRATRAAFETYAEDYRAEMRASYRAQSDAWRAVLARDVVTVCCYCINASACHRRLLAAMLAKFGATDEGER